MWRVAYTTGTTTRTTGEDLHCKGYQCSLHICKMRQGVVAGYVTVVFLLVGFGEKYNIYYILLLLSLLLMLKSKKDDDDDDDGVLMSFTSLFLCGNIPINPFNIILN